MKTTKENLTSRTTGMVSDRVAIMIANNIMAVQRYLSSSLNTWFNGRSVRGKKTILIAVGLLVAIMLVASAYSSYYTIPKLSQNYSSAHIGMASDMPGPKTSKLQLTDSLTLKK
jgi:hypothetical protein